MTAFQLVVVFAHCCAVYMFHGIRILFITGIAVSTHMSKWFTHLIGYVCPICCGIQWFSLVESAELQLLLTLHPSTYATKKSTQCWSSRHFRVPRTSPQEMRTSWKVSLVLVRSGEKHCKLKYGWLVALGKISRNYLDALRGAPKHVKECLSATKVMIGECKTTIGHWQSSPLIIDTSVTVTSSLKLLKDLSARAFELPDSQEIDTQPLPQIADKARCGIFPKWKKGRCVHMIP